jgi:hypothetical protein
MSRRQHERTSRFLVDIEQQVHSAAAAFRDNDVDASMVVVERLWWTSRLRGRRFAQLLHQARQVTQARISLGVVELGDPGRREAMPYFLAVLRSLVNQERRRLAQHPSAQPPQTAGARGVPPPSPTRPLPQRPAGRPTFQSQVITSGNFD